MHFLFTQKGTVCTQMLVYGSVERWEGRLEFANVARFAGCLYNEYEFPADRTTYRWSIESVLNGDVLKPIPRTHHGKSVLSLLKIRDESEQNNAFFDADVLLLPSDVLHIVSAALNASRAASADGGQLS